MIEAEDILIYRENYEPTYYERAAAKMGSQLVVPLGAVWAIRALCDEVERLNARVRELESRLWDESLDDAISPTMTVSDA